MKRRTVLGLGLGVVTSLAVGACSSNNGGAGQSGGSKTVRIILANHVWTENIKKDLPQFEQQTGIKIELTQLAEDQLSDQYNVKLNAGSTDLDVMMYRPLQEGKMFAKNGWMADLSGRVKQNTEWDWADYQSGPVEATTYQDKVVGVPIITEREVLYYRTDLLSKSGFSAPPASMDELKTMAAKIQADNSGTAGFVARTAKSQSVTQFSSFLFSYGGDFDKDGKATINTDEALRAYQMYSGLIRENGPRNVSTDMAWPDAMAIFTQGGAAFYTEADSLYLNATDPSKSKVANSVGFAPLPAGPAGSRPYNIPSWALGVNQASENQDNAWTFIEWATSKDQTLRNQQSGVPSARGSVWDDPTSTEKYPKDLVAAIKVSVANGVGHDRPVVVKVPQAREIVGQPIVDGITGKDLRASVDAAQTAYQKFLDDEK